MYQVRPAHARLERKTSHDEDGIGWLLLELICDSAPGSTLRQHQHRIVQSRPNTASTHTPSPERLMIRSFCRCFCFASPWSTPAAHRGSNPCTHFDLPEAHAPCARLITEASSSASAASAATRRSPTDSFRPGS